MSKAKHSRKRKAAVPKNGSVWHLDSVEATLANKPHYNAYACGHGMHGDAKYNRSKQKRAWQKQQRHEEASRGLFPFVAATSAKQIRPARLSPSSKTTLSTTNRLALIKTPSRLLHAFDKPYQS